jgi:predicted nucleic acid-binding Zn ribbon protein
MPLYEYVVLNADGSDGETLEVLQRIADAPLKKHPQSGQPVRRIMSPPSVKKQYSGGPIKGDTSNKNLERLGFTKYQKSKAGTYEKILGDGPDLIKRGQEQ